MCSCHTRKNRYANYSLSYIFCHRRRRRKDGGLVYKFTVDWFSESSLGVFFLKLLAFHISLHGLDIQTRHYLYSFLFSVFCPLLHFLQRSFLTTARPELPCGLVIFTESLKRKSAHQISTRKVLDSPLPNGAKLWELGHFAFKEDSAAQFQSPWHYAQYHQGETRRYFQLF